ncbi:hypothetical protein VTK56DRAFT_1369 [Thermocarpiscus australiensis]
MQQSFLSELARRNRHNLRTLRRSPAAEISGALGDLGTLLPLMMALALQGSINLPSTLVFSGLFNIVTGLVFGIPLPVQPMKAIASAAISARLSLAVTTAAGALVSLAVLLLSVTGLLRVLTRHVPVPIIKGIQLGAGLRLITSAASALILPLPWWPSSSSSSTPPLDTRASALLAFLLLLLTQRAPRFPYALLLTLLGLSASLLFPPSPSPDFSFSFSFSPLSPSNPTPTLTLTPPNFFNFTLTLPNFTSPLALSAALSQLPLTTLNSVIAASALAADLFPPPPPGTTNTGTSVASVTALGLSVGAMNLAACWAGAMPVCHGAGGLAAQHRFGARSGASVVLLGTAKLVVGAAVPGEAVMGVLRGFPRALLGVMVIAAGLELGKVGGGGLDTGSSGAADLWEESVADGGGAAATTTTTGGEEGDDGVVRRTRRDREVSAAEQQERWMVMLVTAAGLLAFKNDAVGFLAGVVCHASYKVADWVESRRQSGFGGTWFSGERRPLLW